MIWCSAPCKWLHSFVPEICKCYLTEFIFTVIVLAACSTSAWLESLDVFFSWKHIFGCGNGLACGLLYGLSVCVCVCVCGCVCVMRFTGGMPNSGCCLPGKHFATVLLLFHFFTDFCLFLCVSISPPFIIVSGMLCNVEIITNQYHCCSIGITCLSWPFLSF